MEGPKRLFRNKAAGRIAGVCAGIANYLDTDITLVRLTWVVLSIVPGGFVGGIIAYLAAWMIMPDSTEPATVSPNARRLTRSERDRKIAGVCGGLSEYFEIDSTAVRLLWVVLTVVPGCIVLGIVAYCVAWFVMPMDHATRHDRHGRGLTIGVPTPSSLLFLFLSGHLPALVLAPPLKA